MSTLRGKLFIASLLLLMVFAGCSRKSGQGQAERTYQLACDRFDEEDYAEAERLAIRSAAQSRRLWHIDRYQLILSYECAGLAALAASNSQRAEIHFSNAVNQLKLSSDPTQWCRIQLDFAATYHQQGNYVRAERFYIQGIKRKTEMCGPEHYEVLAARDDFARNLFYQRKYPEAEAESRAIWQVRSRTRGYDHPKTLHAQQALVSTLAAQEKFLEAETECRALAKARGYARGPEHPETLRDRLSVAFYLLKQSKLAEAEAEFRSVLPIQERVGGREDPLTLTALYNFAITRKRQSDFQEAEQLARRAVEGGRKVLPKNDPNLKDYEQLYKILSEKK